MNEMGILQYEEKETTIDVVDGFWTYIREAITKEQSAEELAALGNLLSCVELAEADKAAVPAVFDVQIVKSIEQARCRYRKKHRRTFIL